MLPLLKIMFLFLSVWWGFINIGKIIYKEPVPRSNILIMAIGITGFIVIQFELYL